jgi:hypothetical protein
MIVLLLAAPHRCVKANHQPLKIFDAFSKPAVPIQFGDKPTTWDIALVLQSEPIYVKCG